MPEGLLIGGVLALLLVAVVVVRPGRRSGREVDAHIAERAAEATEEMIFRKILVPTVGTLTSDRMVSLACKLARPDDAEVEVLYVVEVPMSLPPTADLPEETRKAGEAVAEAGLIGRSYGVRIRGRVTKSRFAGKAIVDVAEREGADLIVMGGTNKRYGEWGRTSEYVFRNAPCDVILERTGSRVKRRRLD
ncbi:MAG TPA: universal stress protein [Actinomycetota bacterium]|nr:universal stress protein [Actinomycetota bacterium]